MLENSICGLLTRIDDIGTMAQLRSYIWRLNEIKVPSKNLSNRTTSELGYASIRKSFVKPIDLRRLPFREMQFVC